MIMGWKKRARGTQLSPSSVEGEELGQAQDQDQDQSPTTRIEKLAWILSYLTTNIKTKPHAS